MSRNGQITLPVCRETSQDITNEMQKEVMKLVFNENKARIWSISKKFDRGAFRGEMSKALDDEFPIPEIEESFQLGDEVGIKYDLKTVKSILRRTCGLFEECKSIIDRSGYVTMLSNVMETSIVVHYPELSFIAHLYPGILKKENKKPLAETSPHSSLVKGSTVYVKPDADVVWVLQTKLSPLKAYRFGENQDKGDVIGFLGKNILIKFNDTEAFFVHPGILQGEKTKVRERKPHMSDAFEFGDKFRVIANMQMLREHDNMFRKLSRNVSQITGKEVIFLGNKSGNYFNVCREKKGPFWVVHKDFLLKEGETENGVGNSDYRFMPGDIVKLKLISGTRNLMKECGIPLRFLETLHECMKVIGYDNSRNHTPLVLVKFPSKVLKMHPSLLEKASAEEEEEYMKTFEEDLEGRKAWKIGNEVFVNAGRPNFVRDVLEEMDASEEVTEALTTVSKIVGFVGPYHVVIQSGVQKYKIHRKYLVSSGAYGLGGTKMDWKHLQKIQDHIWDIIQENCKAIGSVELQSVSIEQGCPPTIKFDMFSHAVTDKDVMAALMQRGASLKKLDNNIAILKGMEDFQDAEVKVQFDITGKRGSNKKHEDLGTGESENEEKSWSEGASAHKLGAEGFSEAVEPPQDVVYGRDGHDSRHGARGHDGRQDTSGQDSGRGASGHDGMQEASRHRHGSTVPERWPNYLHVTDTNREICNVFIPCEFVDQQVRATAGYTGPNTVSASGNTDDVFGFGRSNLISYS